MNEGSKREIRFLLLFNLWETVGEGSKGESPVVGVLGGRSPGEFLLFFLINFYRSVVALEDFSRKESACNAGDADSIPGSGRSPGGRHGNSLQDSCLENPMDREAWRATYSPQGRKGLGNTEAPEHTHTQCRVSFCCTESAVCIQMPPLVLDFLPAQFTRALSRVPHAVW